MVDATDKSSRNAYFLSVSSTSGPDTLGTFVGFFSWIVGKRPTKSLRSLNAYGGFDQQKITLLPTDYFSWGKLRNELFYNSNI